MLPSWSKDKVLKGGRAMSKQNPTLMRMTRAPFLSSILAPTLTGTLLSANLMGAFNIPGFILVLIMGVGLHVATNVYNDIYDTIQGTDKVNVHRNEFSGGSGVLLDHPDLMPKMYQLARSGLVVAGAAALCLLLFIDQRLWPLLALLFVLAAFFSKFYTAAPVKLASRGFGEVSVWFAFGPMAVLAAAIGQNVGLHETIYLLMPIHGLSTLSILLLGQLIDVEADTKAGKLGVASRLGTRATAWIYLFVQSAIILNVFVMFFGFPGKSWPVLISLVPYLYIFPKLPRIVLKNHANPDGLKPAAGLNVQLHLVFSFLMIAGLLIYMFE